MKEQYVNQIPEPLKDCLAIIKHALSKRCYPDIFETLEYVSLEQKERLLVNNILFSTFKMRSHINN
jgi:hypothetical protein